MTIKQGLPHLDAESFFSLCAEYDSPLVVGLFVANRSFTLFGTHFALNVRVVVAFK